MRQHILHERDIRQHIIQYRLYGSTFYSTCYTAAHRTWKGYTVAHYTIQAIRQNIIQ
jgi:hypothetical protein